MLLSQKGAIFQDYPKMKLGMLSQYVLLLLI